MLNKKRPPRRACAEGELKFSILPRRWAVKLTSRIDNPTGIIKKTEKMWTRMRPWEQYYRRKALPKDSTHVNPAAQFGHPLHPQDCQPADWRRPFRPTIAGTVRDSARRGCLCRLGATAWSDGDGRLPASLERFTRGRGCLSSHLPRSRPKSPRHP